METNSINTLNTSLGASASSAATLADSLDTFLILLITQLRNQDPLSPMDSNEFTTQLVQFSAVEQSIATNENLETLIKLSFINGLSGAVGYLGKTITAEGATTSLNEGTATWNYILPTGSETTDVVISDASGKVVFVGTGETRAGEHQFTWDGRDNGGSLLADGQYTIDITATAPGDAPIPVATLISGEVVGIEALDGEPILIVGNSRIPLNRVTSVIAPDTQTGPF